MKTRALKFTQVYGDKNSWFCAAPWLIYHPGYRDQARTLFEMNIHFEDGRYWTNAPSDISGHATLEEAIKVYTDLHTEYLMQFLEE